METSVKAQAPSSCQLCDYHVIKWKCNDCVLFMCSTCKDKMHPKFKSADDHKIVHIKDIGDDTNVPEATTQNLEVTPEVISSIFTSYTTILRGIHSLLCFDDDIVYSICNVEPFKFMKGKMLKASMKVMQSLDKRWFDITLNSEGELLFDQSWDDSNIYSLSPSGEIKSILDVSPLVPLAIHINKDNELIIGLREPGPPFPVKAFSVRQVMIFDSSLQRKIALEYDDAGQKLFNYVFRICTDSNNTMYIIDWKNKDKSGRVLAVDRKGRLRFSYSGYSINNDFVPMGIVVTPKGNIIVTDYLTEELHVLNSKGELIGLQVISSIDIKQPSSLCIDSEGFLLIGCNSSDQSNAKIYAVKISEDLM